MNQACHFSEDRIQFDCVQWFRGTYPEYFKRIFHIPNGGLRSKSEAKRLKDMGVLKGVSDLFLSIPRGGYGGAFIEMKAHGGSLSADQKDFISKHDGDYYCSVCYSFDDFKSVIEKYLSL